MCNGTEAKQTKKQTKTYSENSLQLPHPEYRRFSKLEVLRDYSFKKYSYQLNVCHSKCLWQKWCPRCEELYTIMRSYFGIYLIDNESKGLPVRGVITSFFFFFLYLRKVTWVVGWGTGNHQVTEQITVVIEMRDKEGLKQGS